jgi:hypothetical protein
MTRTRKSLLWVLAGVVISLLALAILGGQALAQEAPPGPDAVITGQSMSSDHYGLNWNVVGTGGGVISSAHFTVNSTIGQAAVGIASSDHYEACIGYWCWLGRLADIFLPLLMKP